ncbi:GLE1 domain-containing protein (plasmid) [Rhizobium phaseoli]|uniref:YcnI family protein n=1 Tax=Rhizobium phaseoli TaxID=396 RepID=A0A7X6F784_9HYPH|nr:MULTISPECIES: YcnI family protein [Rhizobium]ANL38296.1 GLE1 domain-containing protein [Rhizobium phaseoli]ANL69914.1 GLE1 domain-containing protein [Rhizobium phaseoli]ANL76351.1 GLE1 domain-containing protein [Rhizobium phaseoli]ANL82706.1 GLE1 domain-containing protein [Rhizobium phaseoli]ANM02000.1 GLE1 domain-containing protein [Rhizobium phaseoli]
MLKKLMTTAAVIALATTPALAHVTLQVKEAPVGGNYKAILQVPHGCDGKATTKIRVQIPDGVIGVKPQPKPGWQLEKVKGAYKKTYDYYGTPTSEGVKEVIWSGGSLADDEYDEFALRAFLTTDLKPGETLYFPVVQECGDGAAERWIEIPAAGQSEDDLELPAPGMKLLEKASGH